MTAAAFGVREPLKPGEPCGACAACNKNRIDRETAERLNRWQGAELVSSPRVCLRNPPVKS